MLQPLSDKFATVDESLSDWNPLDYNPLWSQGQQSPFSQMYDKDADVQHGSAAETWTRMPAVDSQHTATLEQHSQRDEHTSGRLSEQVTH